MIIEIITAPGKSASISLYETDDPEQLTNNFSKTFNLGKQA